MRARIFRAMSDDWRVRIDLHEHGLAHALSAQLEGSELRHDLETAFHDRVLVSIDGDEVFCYAGTRQQAERAKTLIERLAAANGWQLDTEIKHWHPSAEMWEDPDVPLPRSDSDRAAEHEELMAQERRDAAERRYPDFEVRLECANELAADRIAQRLREEGLPSVKRSRLLLIGAVDEDAARALADRLEHELPGCKIRVEGTGRAVYDERPVSPFAVFGGLAG